MSLPNKSPRNSGVVNTGSTSHDPNRITKNNHLSVQDVLSTLPHDNEAQIVGRGSQSSYGGITPYEDLVEQYSQYNSRNSSYVSEDITINETPPPPEPILVEEPQITIEVPPLPSETNLIEETVPVEEPILEEPPPVEEPVDSPIDDIIVLKEPPDEPIQLTETPSIEPIILDHISESLPQINELKNCLERERSADLLDFVLNTIKNSVSQNIDGLQVILREEPNECDCVPESGLKNKKMGMSLPDFINFFTEEETECDFNTAACVDNSPKCSKSQSVPALKLVLAIPHGSDGPIDPHSSPSSETNIIKFLKNSFIGSFFRRTDKSSSNLDAMVKNDEIIKNTENLEKLENSPLPPPPPVIIINENEIETTEENAEKKSDETANTPLE